MHSVGKEPEFTSVFSPPECIWMPFVVASVYTNSSAPAGPSLPYQRWQCAFARQWVALLSAELSSQQGWPPDVCVTEKKPRWEQKIAGQWLFMENEWQRKTCKLHFIPPLAALIQRKGHRGTTKISATAILHEKAKLYSQSWQIKKTMTEFVYKLTLIWHISMHHLETSEFKIKRAMSISKDRKVHLVEKVPRAICGCRSGETDAVG